MHTEVETKPEYVIDCHFNDERKFCTCIFRELRGDSYIPIEAFTGDSKSIKDWIEDKNKEFGGIPVQGQQKIHKLIQHERENADG